MWDNRLVQDILSAIYTESRANENVSTDVETMVQRTEASGTMPNLTKIRRRLRTVRDLVRFLWEQRLWWLIPMVLILVAVGTLLVFAQGSAVAPFIYTLF